MAAVGEVLIDLVGYHPHVVFGCPLADGNGFCAGIHRAARVVGRNKEQHLGARCLGTFQLLDGDFEFSLFGRVDYFGHTASQRDCFGIRSPIRCWANHFVAGVAQCGERHKHCVLATDRHQHLRRGALEATVTLGFCNNRIAQDRQPGCRCVAVRLRVARCLYCRFNDVFGCGEIGLTGTKADDMFTFGLQCLCFCIDCQRGRFGDGRQSRRHP